tara:strand:+ start:6826 stop:7809 length:984 start_codon:yes stop_codon:yes gene_type:complete
MPRIKSPVKRKPKKSPVKRRSPRKMNLSMKRSPYGKLNKKIKKSKSVPKKSNSSGNKKSPKETDDMSYGEMFRTMAKLTNFAIKKAGGFSGIANRAKKYIQKLNITNTSDPKSRERSEKIKKKLEELIEKFEEKMKEFEDYIEAFKKLNDYVSSNIGSELEENEDFVELNYILNGDEEGNILSDYEQLRTDYENWLEQTKSKILINDCENSQTETTKCMELIEEMVMTFTYFNEDLTSVKNVFQEARSLGNRLDLNGSMFPTGRRLASRGSDFSRSSRDTRGGLGRAGDRSPIGRSPVARGSIGGVSRSPSVRRSIPRRASVGRLGR